MARSARPARPCAAIWQRVWPAALYLALPLGIAASSVRNPLQVFIGGPGDPQQFMWYLRWFWYAILHGYSPFHTALINYPNGQNLMWNTSILALSAVFGWLAFVGNGAVAYNLLWLLNAVGAAGLGAAILREFGVRRGLSIVGGCFTAFIPYTTAQSLYHIHLWFILPLLFLVWWAVRGYRRGVDRPIRYGVPAGAAAAFEFYTSVEVFATALFVTVLFLAVSGLALGRSAARLLAWLPLRAVMAATVTLGVLILPGLDAMFRGPARPQGNLLPSDVYVNDLLNFVFPTPVYLLHSGWTNELSMHYTGNFWENNAYLGIPLLLVLPFALWALRHHRIARCAAVTAFIVALLSLGPRLHVGGVRTQVLLPWGLVEQLPLLGSALPSRLMLYADLLVVWLLFTAAEIWLGARPSGPRLACVAVAGAVIGITWFPQTPYDTTRTPPAAAALRPGSPVYAAVHGLPTFVLCKDPSVAMQAIADNGYVFPMVDPYGYTANNRDRDWRMWQLKRLAWGNLSQANARPLLHSLAALGASRLLYYPIAADDSLRPDVYQAICALFGPPLAASDGALVWRVADSP